MIFFNKVHDQDIPGKNLLVPLALLALLTGIGVSFALRYRDRATFWRDRATRLLVPLLFGVLVIVPPMVLLEYASFPLLDKCSGSRLSHRSSTAQFSWLSSPWPQD